MAHADLAENAEFDKILFFSDRINKIYKICLSKFGCPYLVNLVNLVLLIKPCQIASSPHLSMRNCRSSFFLP